MQALTPEELQALLQHQEAKGEKSQRRRSRLLSGVAVQPYDMQANLTLTPRQRAMIRQWADQFVQTLRYALIPVLRMTFELRLNEDGLTSLSELVEQWKGKTFVAPMTTSGRLRGDHFLAISTNLSMVVIDRLLGGPGTTSQSLLQRPLSRLEVSLLLKFLERVAKSLLTVITGEEEGYTVQMQNLWTSEEQIGMLTDKVPLYSLCYDFQLGQESGHLWIALRADALKGLEQQFQHRQISPTQLKTSHPVMSLPVNIRVVLASGKITMKELRQLQVGDVILLEGFKGEPARLVWNSRTLCMVRPGIRNGHLAAQVLISKTQQRGEEK